MVELPNNESQQGRLARISRTFRQWLERDFNEPKPFSLIFTALPLLPGMAADEFGLHPTLTTSLFALGIPFAIYWFAYVMYRRFRNSWRDTQRAFADIDARNRSREVPSRCPRCGLDLPAFKSPNDGTIYRFKGWDCENCGTMIDEKGQPV